MSKAMTQSYIFIALLGLNAVPIVSAQSDKSITIHQEIEFNATPQQLYDALLDSKQFWCSSQAERPRSIVKSAARSPSSKAISSAETWN